MSDKFQVETAQVNTQVPHKYWTDGVYYGDNLVWNIAYDGSNCLTKVVEEWIIENPKKMESSTSHGFYDVSLFQECFLGYNPQRDVFYLGYDSEAEIQFDEWTEELEELEDEGEEIRYLGASTMFTAKFKDGKWIVLDVDNALEEAFYPDMLNSFKHHCVIIRAD